MPPPWPQAILDKTARLPDQPGVYIMRDRRGKVIYIGKASSLRNRVRHYFQPATFQKADPKLRGLLRSIADFDTVTAQTDPQAALLESRFIKDYKPRYNILLKDDKRFPLLKIDTQRPFPRIATCRLRKQDGATYFGPYTNSKAARAARAFVEQRFGLRQCAPLVPNAETHRHCHNDIIRYCAAPCIGKTTPDTYARQVAEACAFLRGERPAYLKEIRQEMQHAAQTLAFEKAAALRDTLACLHAIIRERANVKRPALLEQQRARDGLQSLGTSLELAAPPRVMEMFDISNISGTLAVAGMVVALDGRPDPRRYRRFRIKTVEGPDDVAMMAEAIKRRYTRLLDEKQPPPDLVLVDGGLGQVRAARRELDRLGLSRLRVAGLAKRYEELFSDQHNQPCRFEAESPALAVLQQLRDEAHRFAISYHRHLRSRRIRESELDDIPGIGQVRKQRLLEHFGSVTRLKRATPGEIAALPGFGPERAALLHEALHPVAGTRHPGNPAKPNKNPGPGGGGDHALPGAT